MASLFTPLRRPRRLREFVPKRTEATIMASLGRSSTELATDSYVTLKSALYPYAAKLTARPFDPKSHIPQYPKPDPAHDAAGTGSSRMCAGNRPCFFDETSSLGWSGGSLVPTGYVSGSSLLRSHRVIFPEFLTPPLKKLFPKIQMWFRKWTKYHSAPGVA